MAQIIGFKGEELDFLIRQGATFGPIRMTMRNPDGTPVLLGDINFRGQIRKSASDSGPAASFIFTKTDPDNGEFEFEVSASETAAIPAGATEDDPLSQYIYDIEYFNDAQRVLPLLYGKCKVFREVTK